jgi:hypothetical protein
MNWVVNQVAKTRLFKGDSDYYLVRASMVIIYFFFGCLAFASFGEQTILQAGRTMR